LNSSTVTPEQIRRLYEMYVPVVVDTLDEMGYTHQVMDYRIRPVTPNPKVAGPAHTARVGKMRQYPEYNPTKLEEWVQPLIEMLEAAPKGSVIVEETREAIHAATWGELMSNAAKTNGAVGAVTDGAVRDVAKILEIDPPFHVWARNYNPADSKGRLTYQDYGTPIVCGGVEVNPGDIIYADIDGVVVIPQDVAPQVIDTAYERFTKERAFREAIRRGERLSKAFNRYRVF
jgi:regulator of RNase E activity RraA